MLVKDFKNAVASVSPAVSKSRDAIMQGGMVVLRDDGVHAFNDEVYCIGKLPGALPAGFVGAVAFEPLIKFLAKLPPSETLHVKISGDEADDNRKILMRAGKVRCSFILQPQVVELPDVTSTTQPCDPQLGVKIEEAANAALVKDPDPHNFFLNCVHFGPGYAQSTDRKQLVRSYFDHPFSKDTMLRAASIRGIGGMDLTGVADTGTFAVFVSDALVMAVRKYTDEYPPLDEYLVDHSDKPGAFTFNACESVNKSVQMAYVFCKDNQNELVNITLMPGDKVRVSATGVIGSFEQEVDCQTHVQAAVSFSMCAKLINSFATQYGSGIIHRNLLRFCINEDLVAVFVLSPEESK